MSEEMKCQKKWMSNHNEIPLKHSQEQNKFCTLFVVIIGILSI